MGLGNCPKCWEVPCLCGHEYQSWSDKELEDQIAMLQTVLDKRKPPLTETEPPMGELIIWWLSEKDRSEHETYWNAEGEADFLKLGQVPEYVRLEMRSRIVPGHLWVPINLADDFAGIEWDPVKVLAIPGYDLGKCGGIVMWRHDMPTVKDLGGVFTNRQMDQITHA